MEDRKSSLALSAGQGGFILPGAKSWLGGRGLQSGWRAARIEKKMDASMDILNITAAGDRISQAVGYPEGPGPLIGRSAQNAPARQLIGQANFAS